MTYFTQENNLNVFQIILKTFLTILIAVVSTTVVSTTAFAESDELKKGDSVRGASQWADNCSRCHNMRDPKEFRDDTWRTIVAHMRVRAGLTGQQARDILAFLQSSNYIATVNDNNFVKVANSSGASGEDIYKQTCVACHGANGEGVLPGVPNFKERLSKPDSVLLSNMKNGFQSEGSPMAMPAKGGNPALTDADLQAVLSFIQQAFGN